MKPPSSPIAELTSRRRWWHDCYSLARAAKSLRREKIEEDRERDREREGA